jgi:hypothetical protein
MGKTKAEQKAQQSDRYFQIWWNSSNQSSENKAKAAERLGPGSKGGTDKSSKRGRKMKGFGLEGVCVILILVFLGVLAYLHYNKKSANQLAQAQMVDTISVERVQIPSEAERGRHRYQQEQEVAPATNTKPEVKPVEKKVEAPVTTPVKEEVKVEESKPALTKPTNSKVQELEEWLASHAEPQMPRGSTDRADWDKYSNDHYEWARKNSEYQGRLKGEIND